MTDFEFQFTDGFTGQTIAVLVDGNVRAEFEARSKFTTGLAQIVPLTLQDGKEVTVQVTTADLPDPMPISQTITVDAAAPFIVIAWVNGGFEISSTGQRPGYL